MREKQAREILKDGSRGCTAAAAYLEALDKAKGLEEGMEAIAEHQKFVGGRLSDLSTIRIMAERILAKYRSEK